MADAPKKTRGRPRKHTNLNTAHESKLIYDRERKKKLLNKLADAKDIAISSVPEYPGCASFTVTALPATLPAKEPAPLIFEEESLPAPLSDEEAILYPLFDDESNDNKGGHTVEGSGGGHIDEDIYGVSDGDQEPWIPLQDNQASQAIQDSKENSLDQDSKQGSVGEAEIDALAAYLTTQTLYSQPRQPSQSTPVGHDDLVAQQLADHLYSFRGCLDEAHEACDAKYDSYTSMSDILSFQEPGKHIPDVLSDPGLLQSASMSYNIDPVVLQQLYEGWTPDPDDNDGEPEPPKRLYLPHRAPEPLNRRANIMHDIDSLCLFPTSLGVAKQGLFWQPVPHPIMSLKGNIHFTAMANSYIDKKLVYGQTPLHQIPHCCLGEIAGFNDLLLYAFFPKMHHPHRTTTYVTEEQQRIWVDKIMLPALYNEHQGEEGLLQHFPSSFDAAKAVALSHGLEKSSYDHEFHLSRQQLIKQFIQPEKLVGIWDQVVAEVEARPAYAMFQGVFLFASAKDLKSRYMSKSLSTMHSKWNRQYKWAIDSQFQPLNTAYVDLGKQITAQALT